MGRQQLQRVASRHQSLMDFMLQNPAASAREAAEHLGWTEQWVSIVKNSDSFREMWAQYRANHETRISSSVIEKTEVVADMALDLMQDRLHDIGTELPLRELRETADMALRRLGYSGEAQGRNNGVNVNVGIVTADILASAKEVMMNGNTTLQLDAEGERGTPGALTASVSGTEEVEDTDAA